MKYVIWFLVAALLIAHQDSWFWTSPEVVFGFIPIGLFYHACISLAAGFTWWLATLFMWPKELEGGVQADSVSPVSASAMPSSAAAGSIKEND
jgi:hypothetical protein